MVATSLVSQLPNDRAVVRGCNEDVVDVFRPGDLTQLAHCAGDMDAIRMRLVVQEAAYHKTPVRILGYRSRQLASTQVRADNQHVAQLAGFNATRSSVPIPRTPRRKRRQVHHPHAYDGIHRERLRGPRDEASEQQTSQADSLRNRYGFAVA